MTTIGVVLCTKGDVKNCKFPVVAGGESILTEDHLMAVLKRKTVPEELCSYKYKGLTLTCFGYTTGRAGTETKHGLPPPYADEVYYGDIVVVASKKGTAWCQPTPFSSKEYEEFYQARLMSEDGEGDEDTSTEDSYGGISEDEASVVEEEVVEAVEEAEDEEIVVESDEEDAADEDEIVVSKIKEKKKAPSKATTVAMNTGRGKQTHLLQKGIIEDNKSFGPYREKLMEILHEKFTDSYIHEHAEEICMVIEECASAEAERRGLVRHHANPLFQALYKSVVRRIIGNLDPASYVGNTHLHKQFMSGDLRLEMLRSMTIQDLNPGLYKDLYERQLLREQAQLEGNKAMSTEIFTCMRCKKNQCTYYQLQTRSADEPMTTFITCLNCGKRWKE
jgi:transcription elongation factor S-II